MCVYKSNDLVDMRIAHEGIPYNKMDASPLALTNG